MMHVTFKCDERFCCGSKLLYPESLPRLHEGYIYGRLVMIMSSNARVLYISLIQPSKGADDGPQLLSWITVPCTVQKYLATPPLRLVTLSSIITNPVIV
jgi:hypothetical protein